MRVTPIRNEEEGSETLYEHRRAYEMVAVRCAMCKYIVFKRDLPASARGNDGAAASSLRGKVRAHIKETHGGQPCRRR